MRGIEIIIFFVVVLVILHALGRNNKERDQYEKREMPDDMPDGNSNQRIVDDIPDEVLNQRIGDQSIKELLEEAYWQGYRDGSRWSGSTVGGYASGFFDGQMFGRGI